VKEVLERDLVVLVPCKNMEFSVRGILSRPEALSIRRPMFDLFVHPERDPGCLLKARAFLSPFRRTYAHALVMFDREGCGKEQFTREDLERGIEEDLGNAGWRGRAAAIVIDPELEAWVWSDSPHVDTCLGWTGRKPDLRSWLQHEGFLQQGSTKPKRPKEAMRAAMRLVRQVPSSAIYADLARRVSLRHCRDLSFRKLRHTLASWFGI